MHGADLGTLLRTCDAVGACLAVPPFRWVDDAIARGITLREPGCVHRVGNLLDSAVGIPMAGTGSSLNVAVAGSLVLYKPAGML